MYPPLPSYSVPGLTLLHPMVEVQSVHSLLSDSVPGLTMLQPMVEVEAHTTCVKWPVLAANPGLL